MYLKYFLESGIFAQDSKDSESRTLFYFVTDPSWLPQPRLPRTLCIKQSRNADMGNIAATTTNLLYKAN